METKRCTKCSEVKSISEYYLAKNKKTGNQWHYNYCKACHYLMTKPNRVKWGSSNPEKLKKANNKAMRDYRDRHTAGVYLLHTTKGTYVGQSESIEWRTILHKYNTGGNVGGKGAEILSYVILEEIENRAKRMEREKYYIRKLRPDLNVQYNK